MSSAETVSNRLNFPSQDAIQEYCEKFFNNPQKNGKISPYLIEKNIIKAVAEIFAGTHPTLEDFKFDLMCKVYALRDSLGLANAIVEPLELNLTLALQACGSGKPID